MITGNLSAEEKPKFEELYYKYRNTVINYPVQYSTTPPDWGGVDEYFGRIE